MNRCVFLYNQFKRAKSDYLERYERDYANQVENERKAKEYTEYGLDDWLEVLELGNKERMEEEKTVWCTNHRKRVAAKAKEMRAKRRKIEAVNLPDCTPESKNDVAPESTFEMKSIEDALNDIEIE